MPLSRQSDAPPSTVHSASAEHSSPRPRLPPPRLPLRGLQTPWMQSRPPQQWEPVVQPPPLPRQQLSGPSLAMPLSSQATAPPSWLHSLADAHWPPSPTVPPLPPPLPQTPLTQRSPPQQFVSWAHAPPSLRQQLNPPSVSMPFEAQTAAPL